MQRFPPPAPGATPPSDASTETATLNSGLWYRALLSDALVGAKHVPMISQYFAEALRGTDWPEGACLFLSGNEALFFSPAAIAAVPHLIVACGAQPSLPPDRASATLLVGKPHDWELLPHGLH
jgi:hypothetical protein